MLHGAAYTPVGVVGESCTGLVDWQLQLIQHQIGVNIAQLGGAELCVPFEHAAV